ncbi:DUF4153 domain-containing protein [Candidatus Uhrbacteria bacterium]|nr:DUF4153 domain-containing protein [Candidatus Uhrbacteria bacterium]
MSTKRFSVAAFLGVLQSVVRRFPFPLLISLAGTIVGIVLIHVDTPIPWTNILMVLSLAAPISVALVLFVEGMGWSLARIWILNAILAAFMVGYYFLLPESAQLQMQPVVRQVMWTFAFVFAVTFTPFVRHAGDSAVARFWEFCRRLVVVTILTGIWAVALQLGLMAALSAMDFLFNLTIPDERYAELWVIIAGLFCTTFFLSRVPRQPAELHADLSYPKEVRLFSTFLLVPLVTVYFLILYLYTAKILLTGEWPSGQLAYIVLGFSVVGLVTYLALYPLRKEKAWVRVAGTALCVAMIPQGFMLLWSLWFRVSEYGLTENRYLVYVYGLWLLGVSLYLLISRLKDIRVIPVSLFVLAILGSIGPWGAFSVAIHSQVNRLASLLEANGRFQDGRYVSADEEVPGEELFEMRQILNFLEEREALGVVQPWLDKELDLAEVDRWRKAEFVMKEGFGLKYLAYQSSPSTEDSGDSRVPFSVSFNDPTQAIPVDVYDYVFSYGDFMSDSVSVGGKKLGIALNSPEQRIDLRLDGEPLGYIPLGDLIDEALTNTSFHFPQLEDVSIVVDTDRFAAKMVIQSLQGMREGDRVLLDYFFAMFFLTLKE